MAVEQYIFNIVDEEFVFEFDGVLPGPPGNPGDIQALLQLLPEYVDDAAAIVGGLVAGEFYRVAAGNDAITKGLIKQIE
jgi:hypothetical protein